MADDPGNKQEIQLHSTRRAANLIKIHQREILDHWVDAVTKQIPSARGLGRVEIGDHLQHLLENAINMLTSPDVDACPESFSSVDPTLPSGQHGRERATLKGYTVGQVVHEYAVLRRLLTRFCRDHGVEDVAVVEIITCVIELASLNAVNEFVAAMQETQQKLISTLVHDVRTPMGVASTYVEILSHLEMSTEQKRTAVETSRKNLRRAATMLEELLDSAKPTAGSGLLMHFQEADINSEIKTLCTEATSLYDRKINFSLEDHPVIGIFDLGQIIRTMENLISNAVKFGDESAPIDIAVEDKGDHVVVRVHNEGNPIPVEEHDHIFAFFSRTGKEVKRKQGWGLGLALIKTIATAHGGKVIFESSQTAGTTFGMTLQKNFRHAGDKETVLL